MPRPASPPAAASSGRHSPADTRLATPGASSCPPAPWSCRSHARRTEIKSTVPSGVPAPSCAGSSSSSTGPSSASHAVAAAGAGAGAGAGTDASQEVNPKSVQSEGEREKHTPNTERPVHVQGALTQPRCPTAHTQVPGGQRGHRRRCIPRRPRPLPGHRPPGPSREVCHPQLRHGPGWPRAPRLYAGRRQGQQDRTPTPGRCCQGLHPRRHRTRPRRNLRPAHPPAAHEPAPSAQQAASEVELAHPSLPLPARPQPPLAPTPAPRPHGCPVPAALHQHQPGQPPPPSPSGKP